MKWEKQERKLGKKKKGSINCEGKAGEKVKTIW